MRGKRKTRTTAGQVQRSTTQTTLKDLFQRTNSGTASAEKEQDAHPEHTDPVVPLVQPADPHPPAQPSRPPKPSQLFPIFTKVSFMRERPQNTIHSVDDTKVIDITDVSSDIDLTTEPSLSSIHQPSHRLESSRETSHSPPPSPIQLSVHCCGDTSFPHAGAREHTGLHKTSGKKESNKRTLSVGDAAPLPSSCSQHVRGAQHSYTCSRAPVKRSVFTSSSPRDEGALDFLTKWRQLEDTPSTPLACIQTSLTPEQCQEHLQFLKRDGIEAHPAFARISVHRDSIPLRHAEMWTRRFRPRRANEVLGNERHALYLRDWLRALELQLQGYEPMQPVSKGTTSRANKEKNALKRSEPRGVKRPRVVRSVTKKRGSKKRRVDSDDDLDDFVVFSDTDEEQVDDPPDEDSEDEFEFCQRTLARLHRRDTTDNHETRSNELDTEVEHTTFRSHEQVQTDFSRSLTNTLLITGPPGCGKTAAVYACAEELGWDVFEVYPGIGKRNGASLEHLVGDVGRNHIVQTVHRGAGTKKAEQETQGRMGLRGYLAKRKTGEVAGFGESQEAGTRGQPISVDGDSPTHELQPLPPGPDVDSSGEAGISGGCHAESDESRPIVRQSLVLLEEVDILFKEDGGFWPAVVDFIRCCQRPVVMTCNDPGLVPVDDLPLQNVLVFEPCPSAVAATFLQCVSLTEGCLVPHEDLMVLYESRHSAYGLDVPDAPGYPRTEPVPLPDLRRSITQLQMLCAGARHGSGSEMHPGDEAEGHVRRSGRAISAASRVTRTIEREWWRKMNRQGELLSHVDAELCRAGEGGGEVRLDWAEHVYALTDGLQGTGTEREDAEMGYVVLEVGEGLVSWERDELIAEEAIRHARGAHEEWCTGPMASINPATGLDRARVEHRSRMEEALQEVVAAPLGESVFLDYIPWVRHMAGVEDALARGRRCTRNSTRLHGQREVLRRRRLGGGAVEGSTYEMM